MPQQPPQQQPHYTLIIRLPFPRPPNSAFDSIPQPQTQPQNQTQQTHQTQSLQTHKPTPPTSKPHTPPTISPRTTSNQPSPQPKQQHHQPPPPPTADQQDPSTTTSPAPGRSEGTPSMGSSFSDLSGASVAQSALEEALMSDLRADGGSVGFGSRGSTTTTAGFEGRR
ncbi:hypothetical protein Q7P37_006528 [Cladosporium fusiforme]